MRQVFTSVQPKATDPADHPRANQAGIVCAVPEDPTQVGVRWDKDGAQTVEKCADLRVL